MAQSKYFLKQAQALAFSFLLICLGQFFLIQQGSRLDLILGLLLDFAAVNLFTRAFSPSLKNPVLRRPAEPLLFSLIFVEALLFRLIKLYQIPIGLNNDPASDGWGALRILHEGWHPLFKDIHAQFIFPAPFYELAPWFHFFPNTQYSLQLSGVTLSLISLPFIYWFFRQLAGVPTALLTLAFFAPMRWDLVLSRMAHPADDIHIFIFGTLAFGYYALESQKKWVWFLASLFLSGGFYCYDAFKPTLPLIAVLLIYEFFKNRSRLAQARAPLEAACLLFLLLSAPMWFNLVHNHAFGNPHDHLSIFDNIGQKGFWITLLENPLRTALMFNHRGDTWPVYNVPGHRLLDDATGIFLVLGFGLALTRWKERKYFYPLAGIFWLCLPAALTPNPTHTARDFGAAPFVAFFSALALWEAFKILSFSKIKLFTIGRWALLAAVFISAAYENAKVYFVDVPKLIDINWGAALPQTAIGKAIQADQGNHDYYLEPHFFSNNLLPLTENSADHENTNVLTNYTLLYLAYFQEKLLHPLPWPKPAPPNGKGAWFILDPSQSGILTCLRDWYPLGSLRVFQNSKGSNQFYLYEVSASELKSGFKTAQRQHAQGLGLWGKYENASYRVQRLDPVLNFSNYEDFPLPCVPPMKIQWTGDLRISKAGAYQFLMLTTDRGHLTLDQKDILKTRDVESNPVTLNPGLHAFKVTMKKTGGFFTLFHLLWKIPKTGHFEIIPETALKAPTAHSHLALKKAAETTQGE